MCGIAGVIDLNGSRVHRELVLSMTEAVAHRGPDGSGVFCEDNVGLGHRRLSIIDLSEAAAQPMFYKDRFVMVYNGEVYNYPEIKSELVAIGHTFNTGSDSEVILAAYLQWGKDCVNHFNGMWAFAIYDRMNKTVFCSRDRFGVKPFYYSLQNNILHFGSEIKQLLKTGMVPKVNRKVLADYLVLGLEEHNDETFFEGIRRLLPGHHLTIHAGEKSFKIEKYYSLKPNYSIAGLELDAAVDAYRDELKRSVRYRLRSDVKVGTCLSGGLDSSVIAGIAASGYLPGDQSGFNAFTAASVDTANDETTYAKQVVDHAGLNWHITRPDSSLFREVIDEVIATQEEPFGSPSVFMQYFVMQEARKQGCPVLLDGQGGDETLLGYQRYYPAYLKGLPLTSRFNALMKSSQNSGLSVPKLIQTYYYFTHAGLRIKRQRLRSGFLSKDILDAVSEDVVKEIAHASSDITAMQILELTKTQLPHLLRYEDKNSMRFSIETRLPFLDYKLVELALGINNSFKIKEGYTKYLLRKAGAGFVPESILWRKNKIGFEAPSAVWLKDESFMYEAIGKSAMLNSIFKSGVPSGIDKTILWRLYNVAKWEEVFHVS